MISLLFLFADPAGISPAPDPVEFPAPDPAEISPDPVEFPHLSNGVSP